MAKRVGEAINRGKARCISGWTHHLKKWGKRFIAKAERRGAKEQIKKEGK